MKKEILSIVCVLVLAVVFMADSSGKLKYTGAPGEQTCSESNCHGAGNGSNTSGGLADNAGPGSIYLTSIPSIVNNLYVPGQVYQMTIHVTEQGKSLFGFSFEALDDSGNTDWHIDNGLGKITVTDAVHTQLRQLYGSGPGRFTLTQTNNGGVSKDMASFNFNWTAPVSGVVNLYYAGIASSNNGLPDAKDNVYKGTLKLSAGSVTTPIGIVDKTAFTVFPNPAIDILNVTFDNTQNQLVKIELYSLEGKMLKLLHNSFIPQGQFSHKYSVSDVTSGVYILKMWGESIDINQKIVIE